MEEQIFKSVSFWASIFTLYYFFHGYIWDLAIEVRVNNFIAFHGFLIFFLLSHKEGLLKY